MVRITVPMQMQLENAHLSLLCWVMRIGVLVAVVAELVVLQAYYTTTDANQLMEMILWVEVAAAEDTAEYDVDAELCASAANYDYCYDSECLWSYRNNTCIPMCGSDNDALENCTNWFELLHEGGDGRSVVLATHIMQSYYQVASGSAELPSNSNFFVMDTHRWAVGVTYAQTMPSRLFYNSESHSSFRDTLTVVLDGDGEVIDAMGPAEAIYFEWMTLLAASGHPNLLNSFVADAGENMMPGAVYTEGPMSRISGLEMQLYIECTNADSHWVDKVPQSVIHDWGGPLCIAQAEVPDMRKAWLSYTRVFPAKNGSAMRHRQYHGVRLVGVPSGTLYYFDITELYTWLVASIVVFSLPVKIMRFVATHCLNALSHVYQRALDVPFSIVRELAVESVNILAITSSYYELADGPSGLTKDRFRTWMVDALQGQESLKPDEVGCLVDVCFQEMLNQGQIPTRHHSHVERLRTRVSNVINAGAPSIPLPGQRRAIDEDTYVKVGLLQSRISLSDIINLFKSDRKFTWLEKLFSPPRLLSIIRRTPICGSKGSKIQEVMDELTREAAEPADRTGQCTRMKLSRIDCTVRDLVVQVEQACSGRGAAGAVGTLSVDRADPSPLPPLFEHANADAYAVHSEIVNVRAMLKTALSEIRDDMKHLSSLLHSHIAAQAASGKVHSPQHNLGGSPPSLCTERITALDMALQAQRHEMERFAQHKDVLQVSQRLDSLERELHASCCVRDGSTVPTAATDSRSEGLQEPSAGSAAAEDTLQKPTKGVRRGNTAGASDAETLAGSASVIGLRVQLDATLQAPLGAASAAASAAANAGGAARQAAPNTRPRPRDSVSAPPEAGRSGTVCLTAAAEPPRGGATGAATRAIGLPMHLDALLDLTLGTSAVAAAGAASTAATAATTAAAAAVADVAVPAAPHDRPRQGNLGRPMAEVPSAAATKTTLDGRYGAGLLPGAPVTDAGGPTGSDGDALAEFTRVAPFNVTSSDSSTESVCWTI
eukprot:NODE_185_length_3438_cov_7.369073.p1 GENE.NODE_185_length_3438_cov_7.369073~~NODE_185_length_3438_cov_7.369073.p1  ORF type:complete len:1000 (-),score=249.74 NODE_185_length_3438_cov_7.369073:353-3352(-)